MVSPFAQLVYDACSKIPVGRVTTYAQVARVIGHPKAVRAVGSALKHNPQLITVPCHRVVKRTGEIGEYAKGSGRKQTLLRAEGVRVVKGKITPFEPFIF